MSFPEIPHVTEARASQRGSGLQDAVLRMEGNMLIVKTVGNVPWKKTSGKGAWTRLYDGIAKITPHEVQFIKIVVTGRWRNSSRHAHWEGEYRLSVKHPRNSIALVIPLFSEKKRIKGKKVYPIREWINFYRVKPSIFWPLVKNRYSIAKIASTYKRR